MKLYLDTLAEATAIFKGYSFSTKFIADEKWSIVLDSYCYSQLKAYIECDGGKLSYYTSSHYDEKHIAENLEELYADFRFIEED